MAAAAQYLAEILSLKYGPRPNWGWLPILRERYGYVSPDDWYEATVFSLVTEQTDWLDVGCGRNVFPFNRPTAKCLAERCRLLVGIDPSSNINDNTLVHMRAQCLLEDYQSDRQFDLVTLRMVAEHMTNPTASANALSRLTRPGGQVVIYTVNKWSPAPLLAAVTPLSVHVLAKRLLWNSAERDAFPTAYLLNTRADLQRHMIAAGFSEIGFSYLEDCRSFAQIRSLGSMELMVWRALHAMRLPYPERNILAIYRKLG